MLFGSKLIYQILSTLELQGKDLQDRLCFYKPAPYSTLPEVGYKEDCVVFTSLLQRRLFIQRLPSKPSADKAHSLLFCSKFSNFLDVYCLSTVPEVGDKRDCVVSESLLRHKCFVRQISLRSNCRSTLLF